MKPLTMIIALIFLFMPGFSQATLTTVGTATYNNTEYNLIWDDDNNGNSVIWLDYTNAYDSRANQISWAQGLTSTLTYNLYETYSINWQDQYWRMPHCADGTAKYGYEGPSPDGSYSYTYGFNLLNSELGHLYYEELGNWGQVYTDGTVVEAELQGLVNTGDFQHLHSGEYDAYYWFDTVYSADNRYGWAFDLGEGLHDIMAHNWANLNGLALRAADVDVAPVPEPSTLLLLGMSIIGLGLYRWKRADESG